MALSGPAFSNAGGTLNVTNVFSANVGTFNNAAGKLQVGSIAIATTGDLNNQGGTLASGSTTALSVGGGLDNANGTISAVGALNATVAGAIDNTSGKFAGNDAVTVAAGSLNNTLGSVQSAGSSASLNVANQLLNDKGSIGAATDVSIRAGSLANSGTLRAENDSTINVVGAFSNDGSVTSGRGTTITTGSLNGGTSGVLGAGIKSDGTLGASGDLAATTMGSLRVAGTLLAAGDISAQGADTDLTGSRVSAANIALAATQGNVTTAGELLKDVNAQVRITSTATGILVEMTPQIVDQLNALLAGGNPSGRMAPSEIDRARSEFDRLQNDPGLTPEQKQQLQTLQSVFDGLIGIGQSRLATPGGADIVVGGGDNENTPVVFALAGVGAAGAGTAAGAAGAAGLNGASGSNQGYRDPDSGLWVGGSPPLTLPSLPSLEQLAATNPVIGPIYRAYAAIAAAIQADDKDPSTPGGQRGSPMDIPRGTNEPTSIGGRDYTGHSLDQMQGRGVTPTAVEDAIQNGTSRPDKDFPDSRTEHISTDGRVVITTDSGSGRVITVQIR